MIYSKIKAKADYIADVAENIALNASAVSITEEVQALSILRQLDAIADALDEIAPAYQD